MSETEDEQLATWLETVNDGEGPAPVGSMSREVFDAIAKAVDNRDESQREIDLLVAEAREQGASWALIGAALGTSRQGAHKRYREPVAA
ncbi:MAG: hypothetical protein FWF43_04255 [Propionibacteriaceae bacterium]|nr:hypothetical protein [Propionibacteriaceae bacterium]